MSEKQKKELKLEIQLDDETAQGAYSNLAIVNHSDTEFTIDFMFVQPQALRAKVNSRVITSPRNVKRLIAVLEENLRNYEKTFGEVKAPSFTPATEAGEYH